MASRTRTTSPHHPERPSFHPSATPAPAAGDTRLIVAHACAEHGFVGERVGRKFRVDVVTGLDRIKSRRTVDEPVRRLVTVAMVTIAPDTSPMVTQTSKTGMCQADL